MYLECRHVRTDRSRCSAAAIKGSQWCYYHLRLHKRKTLARQRFEASCKPRLATGTFASRVESGDRARAVGSTESGMLVEQNKEPESTFLLQLPAAQDHASIQLALTEIVQALAANRLNLRRAGRLLYGLQTASANPSNIHVQSDDISYTDEGIPLAPLQQGEEVADILGRNRQF